jgi:hypothetical protein
MVEADTVGLKQEKIPIEVLPGAELHVDQSRQHHEHNPGYRCAFLIHERENPRDSLYSPWCKSIMRDQRLKARSFCELYGAHECAP